MFIFAVLLSATTLFAGQSASPSGDSDKSLGDIAKKVRPKDAKVTTKHVFTDDDVQHGTPVPMPTTLDGQLPIWSISCDRAGSVWLRAVDPKLDVPFPEKFHWQDDLCRAGYAYRDQFLRYEAHKGTATEAEEQAKAAAAWSYFQSTAEVGVAFARLYLEKKARGAVE